jgi:minor extracellular serine protease Vpr
LINRALVRLIRQSTSALRQRDRADFGPEILLVPRLVADSLDKAIRSGPAKWASGLAQRRETNPGRNRVTFRNVRRAALLVAVALVTGAVPVVEATGSSTSDIVVQLGGTPAGVTRAEGGDAQAQIARLRASQDKFLARIAAAGISASVLTTSVQQPGQAATAVELRYFWTANGLALRVPAGSERTIASLPGVVHVEPVREVKAFLDTSVPYTRATTVWQDYGYRGEGMDIGDIDSGIAWDHPLFTTNPAIPPGPAHPKIKKYYTFTAGLYDGNGHGTHVGGIIAGDKSLGHATTNPVTGYGAALLDGMAPKANLFGYKVLSDAGSGSTAGVALAIDQSVRDAADVINLSLGSDVDVPNSIEAVAAANAMAAGVMVVLAAGNAGPGYSTVGTPATRQEPLTVGSSTDPGNDQFYLDDRQGNERFALNLMSNSPRPDANPVEAQYVYVGEGCTPVEYATRAPVAGRVALIRRGTCTFSVKKELAQANGAAAAIIFNNVAGNFSGTMSRSRIVVGALSDVDGQHLVGQTGANGLSSATVRFDPNFTSRVGEISGFSARGPTDDYRIKPEIVAPGDAITSSVPQVGSPTGVNELSGYSEAGGTSMAAPHVSGGAALVRQAHPDWGTREVKAALMNTASQLIEKTDNKPYSIMDQGAGLMDVRAAIDTPALILEPSHSFQRVCSGGGSVSRSHTFAILDKSGNAGTWSLAWADGDGKNRNNQGRTLPAAGWTQSFSTSSVTVPANGSGSFTFRLSIDGATLAEGDYEGRIVATNGSRTLSVPIFARHERCAVEGLPSPVLADPGDTSNGSYTLSWSDIANEVGYRAQQSTDLSVVFSDGAEDGMAGKWTTEAAPNGWQQDCTLNWKSGNCSYWSMNSDQRNATLTLASPVSVPAGSEITLTFASYEDTEPDFDYGYVEVSDDGGATWAEELRINGWSDGWVNRQAVVDGVSGNVLIRLRYDTDELLSAPLYQGWFVDDIQIAVASWSATGDTGADATTLAVSQSASATYWHRVAGLFGNAATPTIGPWSNVVDIVVDSPSATPNLKVTNMTTSNNRAREGDKVTVRATVTNAGTAPAGASATEFVLDGTTVLGLVATPEIPAGGSIEVSVQWDTRGVKGDHQVTATADKQNAVGESEENDNTGTLNVSVQGNKVKNGTFEGSNSAGTGPDGWSGSDTEAGTTSWSQDGSDGSRGASASGNGGNAATDGSPTWTSDPIAVTAGETLDLVVAVNARDASSAATAGLVYLGAAGDVVGTVSLITAPLTTSGFRTLEQAVTIPAGVAEVRVVLTAFAPTDTATSGTVVFDEVGLFAR